MSTDLPEGVPHPMSDALAPEPAHADAAAAPDRETPVSSRPRARAPGSAPPASRRGTHPGVSGTPAEPYGAGPGVVAPAPTPSDIPPAAPLPRLPPVEHSFSDESVATLRRPEISGDVGGPPEINRFLSPPPPAPTAESVIPASEPAARRRSRRTVKIPDDAKAAALTPAPAPVAPAPALPEPVAAEPVAPPVVAAPAAVNAPPRQMIPPTPPVPMMPGARNPPSIPRPAQRAFPPSAPTLPDDVARSGVEASAAAADGASDVIQPMRIINIGTMPPPTEPAPDAPPAVDLGFDDSTRRPSRPPMNASPELEAFVAPAPPPKPPAVEEVEAIAEDEAEGPITAPPPAVRPEEIESIADDELLADRISDVGQEAVAAVPDDIPIDVVVEAPAPKKPPPPPPKRAAISGEPPPLNATLPSVPGASPTPPAARAVEALAALPAPAVAPVAPPAAPPAAPTSGPGAATLDAASARKRQKPWWEEIFSDDYLRTMEKVEPKAIRKECDFIEDRLGLEKGAIMLDLACGPGAHAVELASRGYNVVGYDLSLAMLARAQDEAQERGQKINFLQGDMREMAFEEAFDGIYSWSTSFGYFDDEKNVNVLSRMHRGLRQGGMLLLDVANRDYICPRQPSLVWFEGDGCVCMDEMHVDFFASRLRVKRTVMFDDGRARECEYGIRIYALHELGKMLHDTGFKVVEVTGHPSHPGVFFGSESPRIIVLAERA